MQIYLCIYIFDIYIYLYNHYILNLDLQDPGLRIQAAGLDGHQDVAHRRHGELTLLPERQDG